MQIITTMSDKKCALCTVILSKESHISICKDCLKCADCCIGLEKI